MSIFSACVLTKKPISGSTSTRLRPACELPITTCSCPASLPSTTAHAASSVM